MTSDCDSLVIYGFSGSSVDSGGQYRCLLILKNFSYGLDPESVEKRITEYTKAIIVVDLFGQPADLSPIVKIARKHKLIIIEDSAQAPLASYKGKWPGQ